MAGTGDLRFSGYIVRLRRDREFHVPTAAYRLAARHGTTPQRIFDGCLRGFTIKRVPNNAVANLRLMTDVVESVEPDLEVCAYPQRIPWSIARIGAAPPASPAPDVDAHLFILDTGVQKNHPDLNLVESLSFVRTEPNTDDLNGHGTMVAGCAAAKDNGSHVVGVAPGARIHSYKVLDRSGSGSLSVVIDALERVLQFKRANPTAPVVVNISLGGYAGTTAYGALDAAVASAVRDHGITVVVAAGNSAKDAGLFTPAHTAEALTVGAYGSTDAFAAFSNFGASVDLLAPGKDVVTTGLKGALATVSGTSFSSPYVAGACARYLANRPLATPAEVVAELRRLAVDAGTDANPAIVGVPTGTTAAGLYVAAASGP